MAALPWQEVSLSKTGPLTVSGDIVADADIDLDASSLQGPASCAALAANEEPRDDCAAPLFREFAFPRWDGTGIVPGVTCLVAAPPSIRKGAPCARLAIAKGTTFRLRAIAEDMHPASTGYFVEIERPCAQPCDVGERRCAASQLCLGAGYGTCAFCEGEEPAVCACREGCGVAKNGRECSYDSSPDTFVSGNCTGGRCSGR